MLTKGPVDSTRAAAYVTDVIQGMRLLEDIEESVDVFNIGTNEMVTIREIITKISLLNKSYSISVDDEHVVLAKDAQTLVRYQFSYSPKMSFDKGLSATLEWFKRTTIL